MKQALADKITLDFIRTQWYKNKKEVCMNIPDYINTWKNQHWVIRKSRENIKISYTQVQLRHSLELWWSSKQSSRNKGYQCQVQMLWTTHQTNYIPQVVEKQGWAKDTWGRWQEI